MKVKSYFGNSNFESHKIHFYPEKAVVKATLQNYIFFGIFAAVGTGIIIAGCFAGDWQTFSAMGFFGLIFGGVGYFGIWRTKTKKLPDIDLWEKKFYPAGRSADPYVEQADYIPMEEFERFELESHRVRGRKNNYTCYTLRMVFSGGRIFEILNHGSRKGVIRDAGKLAELLNTPLPECDWMKNHSSAAAALPLLIFGAIWLAMSSFMVSQIWGTMDDEALAVKYIPLIFPAVGVIMIISALWQLLKRRKKREQ